MLQFRLDGQHKRARAATMTLGHGEVQTPVFMPVGTQGSIKVSVFKSLCGLFLCVWRVFSRTCEDDPFLNFFSFFVS